LALGPRHCIGAHLLRPEAVFFKCMGSKRIGSCGVSTDTAARAHWKATVSTPAMTLGLGRIASKVGEEEGRFFMIGPLRLAAAHGFRFQRAFGAVGVLKELRRQAAVAENSWALPMNAWVPDRVIALTLLRRSCYFRRKSVLVRGPRFLNGSHTQISFRPGPTEPHWRSR